MLAFLDQLPDLLLPILELVRGVGEARLQCGELLLEFLPRGLGFLRCNVHVVLDELQGTFELLLLPAGDLQLPGKGLDLPLHLDDASGIQARRPGAAGFLALERGLGQALQRLDLLLQHAPLLVDPLRRGPHRGLRHGEHLDLRLQLLLLAHQFFVLSLEPVRLDQLHLLFCNLGVLLLRQFVHLLGQKLLLLALPGDRVLQERLGGRRFTQGRLLGFQGLLQGLEVGLQLALPLLRGFCALAEALLHRRDRVPQVPDRLGQLGVLALFGQRLVGLLGEPRLQSRDLGLQLLLQSSALLQIAADAGLHRLQRVVDLARLLLQLDVLLERPLQGNVLLFQAALRRSEGVLQVGHHLVRPLCLRDGRSRAQAQALQLGGLRFELRQLSLLVAVELLRRLLGGRELPFDPLDVGLQRRRLPPRLREGALQLADAVGRLWIPSALRQLALQVRDALLQGVLGLFGHVQLRENLRVDGVGLFQLAFRDLQLRHAGLELVSEQRHLLVLRAQVRQRDLGGVGRDGRVAPVRGAQLELLDSGVKLLLEGVDRAVFVLQVLEEELRLRRGPRGRRLRVGHLQQQGLLLFLQLLDLVLLQFGAELQVPRLRLNGNLQPVLLFHEHPLLLAEVLDLLFLQGILLFPEAGHPGIRGRREQEAVERFLDAVRQRPHLRQLLLVPVDNGHLVAA